ncbi:valacyclovir hydrolase [Sitodiplosis mosellana]|uniref:valacyclovir hydrolase n=1 Tax=Sitodiplosis mosellana TaxID=263140 RepID=UPI0024450D4A|nr:valacyclovir hydrolase [Sitodiplosis mosellana]
MLRGVVGFVKNYPKTIRHFSTTSVSMVFEEKQIQLNCNKNTYNINYVRSGHGENAVILLPGALGSAFTDFKPQIEQLPKLLPNYTIIAWDPPGYGKSTPPKRTFPLDFFHRDASVANTLMQSLDFQKYSILGWSDGGITGIIMAAKFNASIEKLVIWGANSHILPEEVEIYESIRDVSKWSAKMREPLEKMYGVEYFPQLWSEWIDGMKQLYDKNNGDICKNDLAEITAKTLIVHGAKDPMILPQHVPFLRENIKSTDYFEFPNGKHNIHLRYADEFNEVVIKFMLNK